MILTETTWNDLSNYRESLEHYGVKGMRWGHRKERQSSGKKRKKRTFSEKQKQRRAQRAKNKIAKAKARSEKKEAEAKKKAEAAAAKKEQRRKKILSNPTQLYKHRKEFSYDEIKKAMETFEWEKRLSGYSRDQINNGVEYINTIFKATNNCINVYNSAARIVNSLGKEKPSDKDIMPFIQPMSSNKQDKDKDKKK